MLMGSRCRLLSALTLATVSAAWPLSALAEGPEASSPSPPMIAPAPSLPSSPPVAPPWPPVAVMAPDPEAQAQLHGNGKLAALLCQGQPLRLARCRFGQQSGLLLTYHATGSVAEVLQFRDGWLDGLIEVYDPLGHLIERTLYRQGQAQPLPSGPTPVPAPGEAALPLPPTVEAGGSDAAATPAPSPTPLPVAVEPGSSVPSAAVAAPPPSPVFGLGLRALVGMLSGDLGGTAYSGAQIVFSPANSGILPELAVGVATAIDPSGLQRRLDVPMSVGYRWNLSRSPAPLYLAASFDIVYARRDLVGSVPGPSAEEAWLLGGSGGLGINLPMYRRERSSGRLLLDMRLGGTGRVDGNPGLRIPREGAEPAVAIPCQFRLLFTLTTLFNFGG